MLVESSAGANGGGEICFGGSAADTLRDAAGRDRNCPGFRGDSPMQPIPTGPRFYQPIGAFLPLQPFHV